MPRVMPPRGFYVFHNKLVGDFVDVTYTTGEKGGGGHRYYRKAPWIPEPKWSTLIWSAVPGLADISANYTFYPELPPGIPPMEN